MLKLISRKFIKKKKKRKEGGFPSVSCGLEFIMESLSVSVWTMFACVSFF